jgi:hypothetical protein
MSARFRAPRRELSVVEREHIEQIKDAAERLEMLIEDISDCPADCFDSSIAERKTLAMERLEDCVMWAVKAAAT